MDVEALRKLNSLTGELQKHKISISSEDALKQAEHILQPLQAMTDQNQTLQNERETTKIAQSTDTLAERQYKLLLEMNNKRFENAITALQNTINTLAQEITRLKIDISVLSTKTSSQTNSQTAAQQNAQKQESESAKQNSSARNNSEKPKEEQKKENHPRQGGFTPGDISIEKMFYFGHK